MGLLDFLKKKKPYVKQIPGPTYLDNLTEHVADSDILKHEWRRKLVSFNGQTKFQIRFYGRLHPELDLIVKTDFAPILVYAVDPENGQEILIFDGCKYGYDALFCNTYTQEQIVNRAADSIYKSKNGDELFEIVISVYNGSYYDDELSGQVDSDGLLELVDGQKQSLDIVERNAFDTFQVYAINEQGERFTIISEELA